LIHPGQTGLVAEAGNVDSFADALRKLQDMPDTQISDMGRHARKLVEQQFSKELYLQRLLSVYADLGVRVPESPATETAPATPANPSTAPVT
jgi:glycosyltransferase involved in cell wall biosynthesis